MLLKLFPLWAPCAALLGFFFPEQLTPLKQFIVPLLIVVMLGMGLTLKPTDFANITKYKSAIFTGMFLQFSIMPLTALLLSQLFALNTELTIGLVLVGSVSGGVASNVITYLAKGNVALSVSMTTLSTLLSVVMTPLLLTLLVKSSVEVPAQAMLLSLFKIILLPVALGVTLNKVIPHQIVKIKGILAPLSVISILIIIAIIVALNNDKLATVGLVIFFATLLHNVIGLCLGYGACYLLGFDSKTSRTIAIEVGMQNSALATALALKFFTPISALPGAIFSIWLNITGSIFAAINVYFDDKRK